MQSTQRPRPRMVLAIVLVALAVFSCSNRSQDLGSAPDWSFTERGTWNTVQWDFSGRQAPDGKVCLEVSLDPRPDRRVADLPPALVPSGPAYSGCGHQPEIEGFLGQAAVLLVHAQEPDLAYHFMAFAKAPQVVDMIAHYSDDSTDTVQAKGGYLLLFFPASKRLTALTTSDGSVQCDIQDAGLGVDTMLCRQAVSRSTAP